MGILDSLTSGLVTAAKTTIYTSIVLGLVAVFGLYYFQTALIYPSNFPVNSRTVVSTPDEFGLPFESVSLLASDGVGLTAYLIKPRGSERAHKVTIVYFHSNAGNMGHRLPIAQQFYQNLDVNVFLLSYRGYGLSQGHANEAGIKLDSIAAIEYVKSHPQLKKTKIVLFGQSIGGAVAIHAASKGRVDGLIVENTFTSLPKLVPKVMPLARHFLFLLHQIWDSEKSIGAIRDMPILFLSGLADEMIPPAHMKALYQIAKKVSGGRYVQFEAFDDGAHNDTCMQSGYFERIAQFIKHHF